MMNIDILYAKGHLRKISYSPLGSRPWMIELFSLILGITDKPHQFTFPEWFGDVPVLGDQIYYIDRHAFLAVKHVKQEAEP